MNNIIEKELLRKKLWYNIVDKIHSLKLETFDNTILPLKDIQNLLLRVLFNNIPYRCVDDDPIFIRTESENSKNGLRDDFLYFNIINYNYEDVYKIIKDHFIKSSEIIRNTPVNNDTIIVYDKNDLVFYYRGKSYKDYNGTGLRYEKYRNIVLCMLIRYSYINLSTYGLANDYSTSGFSPDQCIEAFANPFNRFFDHYYSAFPEEKYLDSKGSFFSIDISILGGKILMVNPPFDINIIRKTIDIINRILEYHQDKNSVQIYLTIPAWLDVEEFILLETHKYTTKFEVIPKKDTLFIDYSKNKTSISPCSIISVIMKV